MLVLSRQRDQTIMIGDDIEITVVDVRGDKVRLGISAPSRVAVHRKEVYEAIRAENQRAARVDAGEVNPRSVQTGVRPRIARLAAASVPAVPAQGADSAGRSSVPPPAGGTVPKSPPPHPTPLRLASGQ